MEQVRPQSLSLLSLHITKLLLTQVDVETNRVLCVTQTCRIHIMPGEKPYL
jgi:hypothetical protein